jgi:hypothetical protein
MRRNYISYSFGLATGVLASTVAAHTADAQSACSEAAIMDFKARLAAMQQVAVRRLEEDFCLRFVRCVHTDPNSFPFRASFESCLHDEAMEKFEGEERKE